MSNAKSTNSRAGKRKLPAITGAVRGKYFDKAKAGFRVVEHSASGDTVFDVTIGEDDRLKWKRADNRKTSDG